MAIDFHLALKRVIIAVCFGVKRRRRSKGNITLCATPCNNGVINGSANIRSKFFVSWQIFDTLRTSQSIPLNCDHL